MLGFFDLEVAGNGIEYGQLSLLDRCDGIVDGERSLFVQQLGLILSEFNVQIVLSLRYFRLSDRRCQRRFSLSVHSTWRTLYR